MIFYHDGRPRHRRRDAGRVNCRATRPFRRLNQHRALTQTQIARPVFETESGVCREPHSRLVGKSQFGVRVLAGSHNRSFPHAIVQGRSTRCGERVKQSNIIRYSRDTGFVGWQGSRPAGRPVRKRPCDRYQRKRKKMNLPGHVYCRRAFEAWLLLGQAFYASGTKFLSWSQPRFLRNYPEPASNSRCHGTSKVVARVWSAAITPSVLRGAIKDGSKSSSIAARSRRRRNSSVRAIISALGRVPERRRETGHSDSRDSNALCAAARNAWRRREEKCL